MGNPRTSISTWTLKSFASLSSLSLPWLLPKAAPNPTGAVITVVMAVMATDTDTLAATTDTDTDTLENVALMPRPGVTMAVDTDTVDTVDTVTVEDATTARDPLMLMPLLTLTTVTTEDTVDTADTADITVVDTTGDK